MTSTEDKIKRFGGRERPQAQEFELETFTEDGTNTHRFRLIPIIPAGHVTAIMDALDHEAEKTFGLIAKLMARVLDNRDGVSAAWEGVEFADPAEGDDSYDPDDIRMFFTGPDNEVYAADDGYRAEFEAFDAGSSRRRWLSLMDPDNQTDAVHLGDMVDIAKWVVGLAVDRPTEARASSTRASRKTHR